MIRIVHIITGLGSGGAENMLFKLLKYSDRNKYYHEVISLMNLGVMGSKIREEGIKVHILNLKSKNFFEALLKTKKICKEFDIINSWLYHADLFSFIVAKILLRKKIIWNIRHSNLDKNANKVRTLMIVKLNSFLSKYVDCITYNSNKAFETHKIAGYKNYESRIIPNGFDLEKLRFDSIARNKIRKELNIKENDRVIITIGRWNIQKDYKTLIKALELLKIQNNNFKLIMLGENLDSNNDVLTKLILNHKIEENTVLLGRRLNISDYLSAADIYVSSSLGESFSNAIGEAMACELSCVVTDVGDSKIIVGETGNIVMPQDVNGLANAILELMRKTPLRNIEARKRIEDNYELSYVVKIYEEVFRSVSNNKKGGQ